MSGLSASLAFEKKGTVRYRYTVSELLQYLHTSLRFFLRFCDREVYIFASEEVQCRYVVINYNYYRPDFKSEVLYFSLLLLCKDYDNLAFLLGEFSDFSSAARSICHPRMRIPSQLRAGSSGLAYKKCLLAVIPFLYLLSFGRLRL